MNGHPHPPINTRLMTYDFPEERHGETASHASRETSHESRATSHGSEVISHKSGATEAVVRAATPNDRQPIYHLLMNAGIFGQADADCVDEMFRGTWAALQADANADTYHWLSCWLDDQLAGFACFGTESLTQGTWDLFWICVAPSARGQGVGRALMHNVVARAKAAGARLMVIYTSSTAPYAPARRLYESQEFTRSAIVDDYYRDGDHLYIYSKRLNLIDQTSD